MKRIGIVGLAGSGKTTLFNALTGAHEQVGTYAGVGGASHVASVAVEDPRLKWLAELFGARKVTPVQMEFVDTPGLAVGAHESKEGNARLLGTLREVDALVMVVREFESDTVPHPLLSIDPARDIREIQAEMVIADLDIAEKRMDKVRKSMTKMGVDKKALEAELEALAKCESALGAGTGVDQAGLTDAQKKLVSSFAFLTMKPRLAMVNVDEASLNETAKYEKDLGIGSHVTAIDAEWEMELEDFEEEERKAFLAEVGVTEPALAKLVRACFEALDLIVFYTGEGGTETRAWEIRRGTTMVDAAGAIHSDIARGFVRAEVIGYQDIHEAGSVKDARARGKLHLEGKEYVVKDGDLVYVRFAV